MLIKLSKFAFTLLLVSTIAACANSPFYHKNVMQGQIVNIDEQGPIICTGSQGNSIEGKTLNVFRTYSGHGTEEGDDGYAVRKIGQLIGGESINDHFARARVVNGEIKKNDFVELKR